MKTYKETFEALKSKNEGALIVFTVTGDPDNKTSIEAAKSIVDAGADMLELGLPFSDPIADGPTIQAADVRALKSGMNTDKALEFVKEIRKYTDIPIGFLAYYNMVYQRGITKFYRDSKNAGINSILIADLPMEESGQILINAKKHRIDTVFMVSPLTNDERISKMAGNTTGFIYAVSRLGVTGAKYSNSLEKSTLSLVKRIRRLTDKPLCVGFGISSPEHVKEVINAGADGAIVGSAIADLIAKNISNKGRMLSDIRNYVKIMKKCSTASSIISAV